MKKTKHQEIIQSLIKGNFFCECPNCQNEVNLRKAALFDNNNFSEEALELYQQQLNEIKKRKESLKILRQRGTSKSETGAKFTNIGLILERLAPTMKSFKFNNNDCRSLFDPIDYVIFEGLSKNGQVNKIFFVDIKTGAARLSKKQKEIKTVITEKNVIFKKY